MTKPCIVISANRGYALTSSRTTFIRRFISKGWQVVIATADDSEAQALIELGATLEPIVFNRGGLSPMMDVAAYRRLKAVYLKWKPSLVQHFHAKPVILGSIAARRVLGKEVCVVNVITGLGRAFTEGGITANIAGVGYRLALRPSSAVIFQNHDDKALFCKKGWVRPERSKLIASSGVDTESFEAATTTERRNDASPKIIMLGRLIAQKGTQEFAKTAEKVRKRWPEAQFLWGGEEDTSHPDAVAGSWLDQQDGVKYVGRLKDVRPLIKQADIFLFPSFYREGVPRSILEASSMGLPTVAFDVPGVREAVRHGETGWLVPVRDVDALAECVEHLLANPAEKQRMGNAARSMAKQRFDIRLIEEQYFQLYRELGVEL